MASRIAPPLVTALLLLAPAAAAQGDPLGEDLVEEPEDPVPPGEEPAEALGPEAEEGGLSAAAVTLGLTLAVVLLTFVALFVMAKA